MIQSVKALAHEAMKLAPADRVELVGQIVDGLEPPTSRAERDWLELAEARLEGVRRGEIETVDGDEFMRAAREHLDRLRVRRQLREK